MPKDTREDLPGTLQRSPAKAQRTYQKTLESAHKEYGSEERAHRTAIAGVFFWRLLLHGYRYPLRGVLANHPGGGGHPSTVLGYYDAPTQVKLFWSAKRYHITPFVYAPGGNEPTGEHESGGGSLAEVDLIGNQRLIGGMTILRGTAANGDRRTVGAYARLGFGQWGILAEHDVTDRTRTAPTLAAFRQTASYAQLFWAVEIAARLSPKATLVVATRVERNVRTGRVTPSITAQAAFKTVQ